MYVCTYVRTLKDLINVGVPLIRSFALPSSLSVVLPSSLSIGGFSKFAKSMNNLKFYEYLCVCVKAAKRASRQHACLARPHPP